MEDATHPWHNRATRESSVSWLDVYDARSIHKLLGSKTDAHLVVLMTGHYHETDVRRWERTLEQRNALAVRQSHAGLVW